MRTKATPPYGLAVWAVAPLTTDPRCCGGSHPSVIPAGTRGTATARRHDFRATNVTFRDHPHPILCLRSMVQTRSDRPTCGAVDQWGHDLNTLGRRLDDPTHETPTDPAGGTARGRSVSRVLGRPVGGRGY